MVRLLGTQIDACGCCPAWPAYALPDPICKSEEPAIDPVTESHSLHLSCQGPQSSVSLPRYLWFGWPEQFVVRKYVSVLGQTWISLYTRQVHQNALWRIGSDGRAWYSQRCQGWLPIYDPTVQCNVWYNGTPAGESNILITLAGLRDWNTPECGVLPWEYVACRLQFYELEMRYYRANSAMWSDIHIDDVVSDCLTTAGFTHDAEWYSYVTQGSAHLVDYPDDWDWEMLVDPYRWAPASVWPGSSTCWQSGNTWLTTALTTASTSGQIRVCPGYECDAQWDRCLNDPVPPVDCTSLGDWYVDHNDGYTSCQFTIPAAYAGPPGILYMQTNFHVLGEQLNWMPP